MWLCQRLLCSSLKVFHTLIERQFSKDFNPIFVENILLCICFNDNP